MPIASYIQKYFWDIDPKKASPRSHPEYYIKRILELGDKKSIFWLKTVFGKKKIKQVVSKNRLSPKSKNYWKISL
ncbi:MAG: hypothetical protein AAB521_00465 [Patescibacteria group bacterium]